MRGVDEKWSEMEPIKPFGTKMSGKLSGKQGERHGMGFEP